MIPSLYIHIPFCKRKCFYCDFYSRPGHFSEMPGHPAPLVRNRSGHFSEMSDRPAPLVRDYVSTLISQIEPLQQRFNTIYIGGGTPTALPEAELERLLKSLGKNIAKETEFTVEANPESLDEEKTKLLLGCGVNRLSIGLQSLDDRKLRKLGRIHNAAKAVSAIHRAAQRGFADISADLIFGVWGEDLRSWESELEDVTKLPITHISCYSLTYEKGTPLFNALENKSVTPLEDETVAAMYEAAIDRLALRGFKQYEISSFAKGARRSRHNMSYWDNDPYIGLGASAVSYIDGTRSKNISDAAEYIKSYEEGRPLAESSEKLSPVRRARETAAVKIRTRDGIDFAWFHGKTGYNFRELERKAIADLIAKDLIKYTYPKPAVGKTSAPAGIALKRKGFLFCDTVSSALL